MRDLPPPESSGEIVLDWLHSEGWTVEHRETCGRWMVTGFKDDMKINATGGSLEEAWLSATAQAQRCETQRAST